MDFPRSVSFTLTNACNLRCRMCGQWSREGYMHTRKAELKRAMPLEIWKRVVDELAENNITHVLLRGGETFLFPGIIELMDHMNAKGIFISVDTNGTLLQKHAEDIVRIGNVHLTISVDGPEDVHDDVRGVKGCFGKIRAGLERLNEIENREDRQISKAITFTISPYSYRGLGAMPDVARDLSINIMLIVPYYYFPEHVGKRYETEMAREFDCPAFSWSGFHHETSGVDFSAFREELRKYRDHLEGIYNFPYMDFSEEDYLTWFHDAETPVGDSRCLAVERWIDIQPSGEANFCVDFPDYSIGNVRDATIKEMWNGEKAVRFREYRKENPLSICHRCGAKYMAEIGD